MTLPQHWKHQIPLYRRSNVVAENKVGSMYPAPMVDVPRPSTIEELTATVAFYGMAEIPADLLACLEEIAADLAEDDGTRRCGRHSPADPRAWQADAAPVLPGALSIPKWKYPPASSGTVGVAPGMEPARRRARLNS